MQNIEYIITIDFFDFGYARILNEYIQHHRATATNIFPMNKYKNVSNPESNKVINKNEIDALHHTVLIKIQVKPTVMSSLCLNEKYFDRIFIPTNNEIITKIKLKLP